MQILILMIFSTFGKVIKVAGQASLDSALIKKGCDISAPRRSSLDSIKERLYRYFPEKGP